MAGDPDEDDTEEVVARAQTSGQLPWKSSQNLCCAHVILLRQELREMQTMIQADATVR